MTNRKTTFFTIAQIALLMANGVTPAAADQTPWKYQNMLLDGDEYLRKEITASNGNGTYQLVDAQTSRIIGVSSFDKTKFAAGQQMVLESIRFGVAIVATTDTNSAAGQTYTTIASAVPAALRNAFLVINQGGTQIVNVPIERMLNLGSVERLIGEDAYFLPALRMLKPEIDFELAIRFPDAGAATTFDATKKVFVEIHLLGPKVLNA